MRAAGVQIGTGTLQDSERGFREEGAMELRSSTEELYFMEPDPQQQQVKRFNLLRLPSGRCTFYCVTLLVFSVIACRILINHMSNVE